LKINYGILITGLLLGGTAVTVWHFIQHGSLALKAAAAGHGHHGKSSSSSKGKVPGADNRLVGGVGVGVGVPMSIWQVKDIWGQGKPRVDQKTG
jgi:hypothetical protein